MVKCQGSSISDVNGVHKFMHDRNNINDREGTALA